ncbi:MAG: YggT family protein, partial [Sphingomonadales bacterium]|nr:YggT family protein [Sphingomonadales bacterium]
MNSLLSLIDKVFEIYLFFIFIWIVMTWLISFGLVPAYSRFVSGLMHFLHRITEPALGRIRRIIPAVGGMDLSPLVLILLIY